MRKTRLFESKEYLYKITYEKLNTVNIYRKIKVNNHAVYIIACMNLQRL